MLLLAALIWSESTQPAPAAKGGFVLDGQPVVIGSQRRDGGTILRMSATSDEGHTWHEVGVVATDPSPRADLGDGNAVRLPGGRIWATYRRNHHGTHPDFAIEIAESRDGGRTWAKQGTIASSRPEGAGPSRGLWAPFLLVTETGETQCYYDDEATPFEKGKPGHQWISMRAWRNGRWSDPVVVAREPKGLSRDGMASVVDLGKGKLICAVEAVQAEEPHAGLLRTFRSENGGRTWSRPTTLYAPKNARFHAFCPSLVRLPDRLVVVFGTNEDRLDSPRSGTPADKMALDIKARESVDGGKNWSPPTLVYGGTHRNYLPSAVVLPDGRVFVSLLDFDAGPRALTSVASR